MCLYPRQFTNKKYTATEKNLGKVPTCPDERILKVQIPCGNCIECREARAQAWRIRIREELKVTKYPYFITLTFGPEELAKLCKETQLKECNAVAKKAVRRCLERFRKDYKHSLKHWLITELGHEGTERIHMHGILFSQEPLDFTDPDKNNLRRWKYWQYGHVFIGEYCNAQTANYIVKYINKLDEDHKGFQGEILCSPGIGKNFLDREIINTYKYIRGASKTYYRDEAGHRIKLPTYYKNHLYTEEERELIWRETLDQQQTYILGHPHNVRTSEEIKTANRVQLNAQEFNENLKYGSDEYEWRKREYNITERMLRREANQKLMIQALKDKGLYNEFLEKNAKKHSKILSIEI